jgi:hypothetical protein
MNPGKARSVIGRMMAYREARLEREPDNQFVRDEWNLLAHVLGMVNAANPPDERAAAKLSREASNIRLTEHRRIREKDTRCTCERCPVHSKKEAAE